MNEFLRFEKITPEGLRLDGRRSGEIRDIKFKLNVFSNSDGSCLYQQGNTKIITVIHGPVQKTGGPMSSKCVISCEFSQARFSTGERRRSPATSHSSHGIRSDRKSVETSFTIQQTFQDCILRKRYPNSEIKIFVRVIEDDGSILSSSINSVSLALIDAGIAQKDVIVACSSTLCEHQSVVDPSQQHVVLCDATFLEFRGCPEFYVALLPNTEDQEIAMIESKQRIPVEMYNDMLEDTMKGCYEIYNLLKKKLKENCLKKLEKRVIKLERKYT